MAACPPALVLATSGIHIEHPERDQARSSKELGHYSGRAARALLDRGAINGNLNVCSTKVSADPCGLERHDVLETPCRESGAPMDAERISVCLCAGRAALVAALGRLRSRVATRRDAARAEQRGPSEVGHPRDVRERTSSGTRYACNDKGAPMLSRLRSGIRAIRRKARERTAPVPVAEATGDPVNIPPMRPLAPRSAENDNPNQALYETVKQDLCSAGYLR